MNNNTCKLCSKNFNSISALSGHMRAHGPSSGLSYIREKETITLDGFSYTGTSKMITNVISYHKNPNHCKQCSAILKYRSYKQLCNHSCSASFTNKSKNYISEEQKEKISKTLKEYFILNPRTIVQKEKITIHIKLNSFIIKNVKLNTRSKAKHLIGKTDDGLLVLKCYHCQENFIHKTRVKYCPDHIDLYKSNGRNRYAFTFNIFDYPTLFDLELIKSKGWHSYGGRFKYNPEGLTRDHKVSVNESIKNNYDPYYIKHPINCEVMTFKENNRKKTKSSITYEELVLLINEFEKN